MADAGWSRRSPGSDSRRQIRCPGENPTHGITRTTYSISTCPREIVRLSAAGTVGTQVRRKAATSPYRTVTSVKGYSPHASPRWIDVGNLAPNAAQSPAPTPSSSPDPHTRGRRRSEQSPATQV